MPGPRDTGGDRPVVLIVDDEEVFRKRLVRAFKDRNWEAHETGDAQAALNLMAGLSPDLVLLDLKMPEVSGLDLIASIKALDSTIAVIILTGDGSIATAMQALKLGADHYLSKPVDVDQILEAFRNLGDVAADKTVPAAVPSLARVEWEHIQRVLSDCSGNVSQAARLLGIHRRSLQRKLAKYPPSR
jgi:two-component system response regulator RegA